MPAAVVVSWMAQIYDITDKCLTRPLDISVLLLRVKRADIQILSQLLNIFCRRLLSKIEINIKIERIMIFAFELGLSL